MSFSAYQAAVEDWMMAIRFWELHLIRRVFARWKASSLKCRDDGEEEGEKEEGVGVLRSWSMLTSHQRRLPPPPQPLLLSHPVQILAIFRWIRAAALPRRYVWDSAATTASQGRGGVGASVDFLPPQRENRSRRLSHSMPLPHQQQQQQHEASIVSHQNDQEYLERRTPSYLIGRLLLHPLKVPLWIQANAIVDAHLQNNIFLEWRLYAAAKRKARHHFRHRYLTWAFHQLYSKAHCSYLLGRHQHRHRQQELGQAIHQWKNLTRIWASLPSSRTLDRIAQRAAVDRCWRRWMKRMQWRERRRQVERRVRDRMMVHVLERWEDVILRRKKARSMHLALLLASERNDVIWGFRCLLMNAVLTRHVVLMQKIARGFLGRIAAENVKRIKENEQAIGELAIRYSMQRIERAVLLEWYNAVRHVKGCSEDLANRVRLRRVLIGWSDAARMMSATRRLVCLCSNVEEAVPVRLAFGLWRDKALVLRYLEQTEATASDYAREKVLSRALARWNTFRICRREERHGINVGKRAWGQRSTNRAVRQWFSWIRLSHERWRRSSDLHRWYMRQALKRWTGRINDLQALAMGQEVARIWRSGSLLRTVLLYSSKKALCRCQAAAKDHVKGMIRLEACGRMNREKVRRKWRLQPQLAEPLAYVSWRKEAWALYALRFRACLRSTAREAMEKADRFWARKRLKDFVKAVDGLSRRMCSMAAMEQAERHCSRQSKAQALSSVKYYHRVRKSLRVLMRWTTSNHAKRKLWRWFRRTRERRRERARKWKADIRYVTHLAQRGLKGLWQKYSQALYILECLTKMRRANLRRRLWSWRIRTIHLGNQRKILKASKAFFGYQSLASSMGTRRRKLRSSRIASQELMMHHQRPPRERKPADLFLVERLNALDGGRLGSRGRETPIRRHDLPDPLLSRIGEAWFLHQWLHQWVQQSNRAANRRRQDAMALHFHHQSLLGWAISTLYLSSRRRRKDHQALEKAVGFQKRQRLRWLEGASRARCATATPYDDGATTAAAASSSLIMSSSGVDQLTRTSRGGPIHGLLSRGSTSAFSPLVKPSAKTAMDRAEKTVTRRVFTALVAGMWRRGTQRLWMREGDDHWRGRLLKAGLEILKIKAMIRRANHRGQKYHKHGLLGHAFAELRRVSQSRSHRCNAVNAMLRRRLMLQVDLLMKCWSQSAKRSLEYLRYYSEAHLIGIQRVAMDRWFKGTSKLHLSRWLCREAVRTYDTKRAKKALCQWRRLACGWKIERQSVMHAIAHVQGRALGQAWLRWSHLARAKGRCRGAAQVAARYIRRRHLGQATRHWRQVAWFNARFQSLSQASLSRRLFLKWKKTALRDVELRAFTMALKYRHEVHLLHTTFHALSYWTSRQVRLRQAFYRTATKAQNRFLQRTIQLWANRVCRKRQVLIIGMQAGVSHCVRLLRQAFRDWRALYLLQKDGRVRLVYERRQTLWLWLIRASIWKDTRIAQEKAVVHRLRRSRRQVLRKWRDVAFRWQCAKLAVEDGDYYHHRRLQMRFLHLWRGETELGTLLQEVMMRRAYQRGLRRLKENVQHMQRQRLGRALKGWKRMIAPTKRSRRRVEVGLERALARFFQTICLNRWKERTRQALASRRLVQVFSKIYRRHSFEPYIAIDPRSLLVSSFKVWKEEHRRMKRRHLAEMWTKRTSLGSQEGEIEPTPARARAKGGGGGTAASPEVEVAGQEEMKEKGGQQGQR